jgi:hypothetical protein
VKRLERTWADNPINSLLRGLKPHISHLQLLVAFLAGSFGVESITSACLLGLIGLMLQVSQVFVPGDELARTLHTNLDQCLY